MMEQTEHPPTIRLLLVEDHHYVRRQIATLLRQEAGVQVVGEAGNGKEAIEMERERTPAIIVMDLNMPEMDGIESMRQILRQNPDQRVVVLSQHEEQAYIDRAVAAGARAYVFKRLILTDLIRAIRIVVRGGIWLPCQSQCIF